jgi:glycosyltransferase involved in cell wall biosynthesis
MLDLTMGKPITFSLVIPFGGNSDLLMQTVKSVLNQSYKDWSLLIINDGTDFDLHQILEIYANRIEVLSLPEKIGIARIFDLAIDKLTGEIGMILGADDLLEENFLQGMSKAWATTPNVALIHPKVLTIDEESRINVQFVDFFKRCIAPTNFKRVVHGRLLLYSLLNGNWMYFTSSTFNVSKLKAYKFNSRLKIAMDWELALRMGLAGETFGYCKDATFYYRRHKNSLSMMREFSILRLQEEILVVRDFGRSSRNLRKFDLWIFSGLHFNSYLNFLLRKFSKSESNPTYNI